MSLRDDGLLRAVSSVLSHAAMSQAVWMFVAAESWRNLESVGSGEQVQEPKSHGRLVPVSSTHRCAYTSGLSTSSSSRVLQGAQGPREVSS